MNTSWRFAMVAVVGAVFLLFPGSRILALQQDGLWVAFRYDEARVLFYGDRLQDPVRQDYSKPMKSPAARYGAGGYLLPLTAERLQTFRDTAPPPRTAATPGSAAPALGQRLTLMLGGGTKITATVEEYVEQWGSENPVVAIGALARIPAADLARFRDAKSSYFLIAAASRPMPPAVRADESIGGTTQVLNQFDGLGELILTVGEAGWSVTLFSRQDGSSRPTGVRYFYGD
jgi:hypothetical protein